MQCQLLYHSTLKESLDIYCPYSFILALDMHTVNIDCILWEHTPLYCRKLGTQCVKTGTTLWVIFLMELAYCSSVLLEVAVACTFFFLYVNLASVKQQEFHL